MSARIQSGPAGLAGVEAARGRKIRVLHLLHTIAYGGPETIIINWIRHEDTSGFEPHLVCFSNPGGTEQPFINAATAAGLKIDHTLRWNRFKPVLRCAWQLAAYIRLHKIDIVHCYNTYAELVGVTAKRFVKVKLITTKWMWGKLDWKRGALQWLERSMLPLFDRVSAQSEFAARLTDAAAKKRKVDVLISGIDQPIAHYTKQERDLRRAEWGAQPESVVFLHLARFYPEKAHDVLLRAFRTIANERADAVLWLAGVGPLLDSIKALAVELELTGRVHFLGFCPDLAALLPLGDIQIHSSHMEGIPLALCSGMAAGLPVLATRVGGVDEIVKDGVTGRLVGPGKPDELAHAALPFIDDAELRFRCGRAGQSFIEREYSIQAAVNRLERLYREMVGA